MELFSNKFKEMLARCLDSEKPVLAIVMERPHPIADKIKRRPDVERIRITSENRDRLARQLAERLLSWHTPVLTT